MALDLTNLTVWKDEQRLPIISKLGIETATAPDFQLMTGVKGKTALNLLGVTANFQDAHSCSLDASAATTFTQRDIEPGFIRIEEDICANQMIDYWMNYQVQVSANRANLPFEDEIANKFVDATNEKIEKAIWQGVKANDYFDGLATILDASSGVKVVTDSSTSTAYDRVLAVYNAIPEKVLGKAVIYENYAEFRALCQQLVKENLYNFVTVQDDKMMLILPGTNTVVKAKPGLSGLDSIFALVPEHTFYACDLVSDKDDYRVFYVDEKDKFKLRIKFTAGVQVAFPDECVRLDKYVEPGL